MAASFNDMYILATSSQFQNRVSSAIWQGCLSVANEGSSVAQHLSRSQFVAQVLANPTPYITTFSNTISTNATVISDATSAGTVVLSTSNIATQQALVTDAHITSALNNSFLAFLGLA